MPDVQRLLQQFIEDDRAGRLPEPTEFVSRLSGVERRELEALIDAYLAGAPRRPYDAEAFERSPARVLVDDLARSLAGESGAWPAVLPRLRHRARLRRADLVVRLTAELGVSGREEKVGAYYHEMERGSLPAGGVSDRVLVALARILGETAERLRDAGRSLRATASAQTDADVAFARTAVPGPDLAAELADASIRPARDSDDRDEVDELFTGASDDAPL